MNVPKTAAEFMKSIYVGDRACKAIRIESWRNEVAIEIDLISRIRSTSGEWDFYADEDVVDGRLVFTGVDSITFSPSGPLPNDFINAISVTPASLGTTDRWLFEASISSTSSGGRSTEVIVRITASDVHIEDPARENLRLRE